jgi:hypothetical protein
MVASIVHASQFDGDLFHYLEYGLYIIGLIFAIGNLIAEAPVDRPEFKAILVLPPVASVLVYLNGALFAGYVIVAFLAYKQYKKEFKYALLPFIVAFSLLSLAALIPLVHADENMLSISWISEHLLHLAGFFALGVWVWSYLQLRIREELLLVLIGTTLFMATVISLSFSTLLVSRISQNTSDNLLVNARMLDQSITRLTREAGVRAELVAHEDGMSTMITKNDFVGLTQAVAKATTDGSDGFLAVVNADGDILVSSNLLSRSDENMLGENIVAAALKGQIVSATEAGALEGFSIRTAAPVFEKGKVIGAVVFGFPLDNAFVDGMKSATGIEMSIFDGNKMIASTEFQKDGRIRLVGFEQNNQKVKDAIFSKYSAISLSEQHASRTAIVAYVPLLAADGKVVGMLSTSKLEREIIETMNITNRYTIVTVLLIMLLLSFPLYSMARRLGDEIH